MWSRPRLKCHQTWGKRVGPPRRLNIHSPTQAWTASQGPPPETQSFVGQANKSPAMSRLPTIHLLRNVLFGTVFTRPWLYRLSMALLAKFTNPNSRILYPDHNPIIRAVMRATLYNHFCAGTNLNEVQTTVNKVKADGYAGVILIPSREIMVGASEVGQDIAAEQRQELAAIEAWKEMHLETLSMIGKGDYMGMKLTGAGTAVMDRLLQGLGPQPALSAALDTLIATAQRQGSRIWLDAEPQLLQPAIDNWAVHFMRKYNHTSPLLSNTYQAYLKSIPHTLSSHLTHAQTENWILGIKLVRGAYIASDPRHLIHDTKSATDDCYNALATGLIARTLPGFSSDATSPDVHVFVAGHNAHSIQTSVTLYKSLLSQNTRVSPARWGQLQGMADEVSCSLLAQTERISRGEQGEVVVPEVYKCLQWGTVGECMQFLLRRATENYGAAERMGVSVGVMRAELKRRFWKMVGLGG